MMELIKAQMITFESAIDWNQIIPGIKIENLTWWQIVEKYSTICPEIVDNFTTYLQKKTNLKVIINHDNYSDFHYF